ncbi:MAG: AAA family ATPase [Verrucomicrobiales bacterium]|nr:AAA family ATPase [Verrucomicrobiales bacterium]
MNRVFMDEPVAPNNGSNSNGAGKESEVSFRESLDACGVDGVDFLKMDLPDRPRLMGDWFRKGDLGFVFAPRGIGKTWFCYLMISALTQGRKLDEWEVPEEVKICLLDGEMPPDGVQERLKALGVSGRNLTVLSHQFLFDESGKSFQLASDEQRTGLLDYCVTKGIDVLVLDNLSSISGISENDNDQWPQIGDWLLDFRRHGIAVIVIHHSGRNGQMRGASRREDPAFWIIKLDDSRERTATEDGARFVTTFTKNRNARSWPTPIDWHINSDEDGHLEVKTEPADNAAMVLTYIQDGYEKCSDIATELDLSKGAVSKIAQRLESNGQISITGKGNQKRYIPN